MAVPFGYTHQLGESNSSIKPREIERLPVDTYGGRIHVEWDPQAAVTPLGQMPFFIEFLKTADLFEPWIEDCPLSYISNNGSDKRDILGTLLLSILSGHSRYSHITTLRSDHVNPSLLGMKKVVSEDTARRGMKKIDEDEGDIWLENHLYKCYAPLLSIPWILDIDSTIKTLYGNQEGAEVGYNPTKPGRPSHTYHTYHIANIRMVLDVEVEDGKSGAGYYSAPKLWEILDKIPRESWPKFIRGDSSYGTENIMNESEYRGVNYLFKLKSTRKVKQLIAKMMAESLWSNVGQGWQGVDSEIILSGWNKSRRVILLRRRIVKDNIGVVQEKERKQLEFQFVEASSDITAYEYQVLVTNLNDDIIALSQHYRDRADCENNFDELKNQWGWCGFTTQDLKRCRLMAKMIALVYNWWTIFTRLANPDAHLEAITSRPLLLHAVAKKTSHAGQTKLTVTSTHTKSKKVSKILSAISEYFSSLKSYAEQLTSEQKLRHIIMTAFRKFLPKNNQNELNLLPRPG